MASGDVKLDGEGNRILQDTGENRIESTDNACCCGCWKKATRCSCSPDGPLIVYVPCDLVVADIIFEFASGPPPQCFSVGPNSDEVTQLPDGAIETTDLSKIFDSCELCCEPKSGPCVECPCDFGQIGCPTAITFQLSDVVLDNDVTTCSPFSLPVAVVVPGNICFLDKCAYIFDTNGMTLAESNCGGFFRIWVHGGPEAQARCHTELGKPDVGLWNFSIAVWCQGGSCQMGPVFLGWENRQQIAGCIPLGNMGQNDTVGGAFFQNSTAKLEIL